MQLDSNNLGEVINEQLEQFATWFQQEDTQNTLRKFEKLTQASAYVIQQGFQELIRSAQKMLLIMHK